MLQRETYNPHGELVKDLVRGVEDALKEAGYECRITPNDVRRAPEDLGDLAVQMFRVARDLGVDSQSLAKTVEETYGEVELWSGVKAAGGYVNFRVNIPVYADLVLRSVEKLGDRYGHVPTEKPQQILVEHTSANPVHPLHIGHLRNCLLGDSLARLFKARGHKVKTHFYIDDVGLQVAYAAYGYSKVKRRGIKRNLKPDHFVGLVYSMTYVLVEIAETKKKLKKAREAGLEEEVVKLQRKLDDLVATANELRERDEELFYALWEEIGREERPLAAVQEINRAYEEGEKWAVDLVREMVNTCLKGFKETFDRLGIEFDSWDWESELTVWNKAAEAVIYSLKSSGLVYEENGALVFAADKLAEDEELRKILGIPATYTVTPLTLTRSDGTTLYPTRDIAYSLWKLNQADTVINVIAVQQTLAQIHVRLALYALGKREKAKNLVHYAYEIVRLPGRKMSGRRGKYVSADELLDEAVELVKEIIEKGKREFDVHEKERIASIVGLGAVKYAFLRVSPLKIVTFNWKQALDLSQNSGPFVQYAYVRAASILRKSREKGVEPDPDKARLLGEEERKLILKLGEFPEVVVRAADEMRPDYVASYLDSLAQEFNSYYDSVPVLKAKGDVAKARLALVKAVSQVIKNGLGLLGIDVPKRM